MSLFSPRQVVLVISLVIGLLLGLVYTWGISPVEFSDTRPALLRSDHRSTWVRMAALSYMTDGDLARVRARLEGLDREDIAGALEALIEEYYAKRKSPAERLVAFQMNWKGENLYTGNRVVVHVSTKNKNFEKWIDKHRGERHFFITEYKRFKKMSRRADAASGPLEEFADTCNKYKAGWADEL